MLLLRAVLNILVRNASTRGAMCFRCMLFSLAAPCELLFLLSLFCLLDLSCGECNVIFLYVLCCSVNGTDFFGAECLTVFVNCVVKHFAICLGVIVILLNVMELLKVVGGALLNRPGMVFPRMCVLCCRKLSPI